MRVVVCAGAKSTGLRENVRFNKDRLDTSKAEPVRLAAELCARRLTG